MARFKNRRALSGPTKRTDIERAGLLDTALDKMHRTLRLLIFAVILLAAVNVGQAFTGQRRNHQISQLGTQVRTLQYDVGSLTETAVQARDAANQASSTLAHAITTQQTTSVSRAQLAHALDEIDCIAKGRIPCP